MHSWAKLVSLLEMPHSLPEAKIQSSFSVLFGSDFHLSILSPIQILGCYSTDVTLDMYCVCIYVSFRFLNLLPLTIRHTEQLLIHSFWPVLDWSALEWGELERCSCLFLCLWCQRGSGQPAQMRIICIRWDWPYTEVFCNLTALGIWIMQVLVLVWFFLLIA